MTCGLPLTVAAHGLDHWPCISSNPLFTSSLISTSLSWPGFALGDSTNLTDGSLFFQATVPLFLSTAMKLGAAGAGMLMWPSSTPLEVTTNTRSPITRGDDVDRLCGKTPRALILSGVHT